MTPFSNFLEKKSSELQVSSSEQSLSDSFIISKPTPFTSEELVGHITTYLEASGVKEKKSCTIENQSTLSVAATALNAGGYISIFISQRNDDRTAMAVTITVLSKPS